MTSIDELFKGAGSSSAPAKRKLDATRNPNEIYKAAKTYTNGSARSPGRQKASVNDEELADADLEAGPALPPTDDDEQDEDGADEEGRFFGGGVDKQSRQALRYLDQADEGESAAPEEKIDAAWIRRMALNFEKRVSKNAELRAKFEAEPEKFMASEADLDADIKGLSILTEHSEFYGEFVKMGCVSSIVGLLAHENADIAIDALQILAELTDEDVQAEQEQWNTMVEAMMEADLPGLLVSNLQRLNESNEADVEGVYHSLSLAENLSSQIKAAEELVENSSIAEWLMERCSAREAMTSQNKQYAAEVLSILLQSSAKNRVAAMKIDAVDLFLRLISAYRKRDPEKESEEEEYAENIFDCLICLVDDADGKARFIEGEGVELCLMMLKEGRFSKTRALRVLDHAVGGRAGTGVCEKLVEAGGLKTLFTMFMKQNDRAIIEHLLGIFASMLRLLPGDSAPRIRILAKFLEKDYEKLTKLVKLRYEYANRLRPVDAEIEMEKRGTTEDDEELNADVWLSRRLDAGLFSLQTLDVILAWLAAEDTGAKRKLLELLSAHKGTLRDVLTTLQEQITGLSDATDDDGRDNAEMLKTLAELIG